MKIINQNIKKYYLLENIYINLKGSIAYWVRYENTGPFRNGSGTDCKGLTNGIPYQILL